MIHAADCVEGINDVGFRNARPVTALPVSSAGIIDNNIQRTVRHVSGEALAKRLSAMTAVGLFVSSRLAIVAQFRVAAVVRVHRGLLPEDFALRLLCRSKRICRMEIAFRAGRVGSPHHWATMAADAVWSRGIRRGWRRQPFSLAEFVLRVACGGRCRI